MWFIARRRGVRSSRSSTLRGWMAGATPRGRGAHSSIELKESVAQIDGSCPDAGLPWHAMIGLSGTSSLA